MILCKCGCGQPANPGKRYIRGHNSKGKHYTLGSHLTPETIEKCRLSHLGKHHTDETKQKIRLAITGIHRTRETKQKIRLVRTGMHRTPETKEKIRISMSGKNNPMYGKHHTVESIEKNRIAHLGIHPKHETIEKLRKAIIQAYRDGKYSIYPNKPETLIDNHIHEVNPIEYKYTGDGSFWIEDVNPDFVNINGQKKCIEHFGCWFHGCKQCYPNGGIHNIRDDSEERIAKYKQYGWDCLVIWEHDIKNGKYKELINDFIK